MSSPEPPRRCWRVFPWDPRAAAGARFSSSFIPAPTGRGRFDLPRDLSPALYLAESPEHAVAEVLQPWRGRRLEAFHLVRAGLPLAVVDLHLPPTTAERLADLCDPTTLTKLGVGPDRTASRHRDRTQPIARAAWDAGHAGVRWWSSFWGDWHTVVLFTARGRGRPRFGAPDVLTPDHPVVEAAGDLLGMLG
ncbi:MAG: RES family NAD+ phosphorylase [Gemmatimonadota bacterium]|nr:RES family NAD+ phosphorylase [Gemmatimonadota bacterium]MDH5761165.1 RES family NAD+ phosphorylase [Gemmatimonadota bacterium]